VCPLTFMVFSRNTLIRGSHPFHAASRVLNASASASSVFARYWVHSTNRTSALIRSVKNSGLRRAAYATNPTNSPGDDATQSLPLYSQSLKAFPPGLASHNSPDSRETHRCLERNAHKMVPNSDSSRCTPSCCPAISQKVGKGTKGGPGGPGR
jgi:hypothetical protein